MLVLIAICLILFVTWIGYSFCYNKFNKKLEEVYRRDD